MFTSFVDPQMGKSVGPWGVGVGSNPSIWDHTGYGELIHDFRVTALWFGIISVVDNQWEYKPTGKKVH